MILYYTEALGMTDYVLIFAPAILAAAIFTALYGRTFDRWGFRKSVLPVVLLLLAGCGGLYFARSTAPVFVASLVMMCGYLGTGAVIGAMIRTHTPENKAGMFQGLRIVCQVLIPGIVGPAISAQVLKNADTVLNSDGTTSFLPNENIFLAAFVVGLLVLAVLWPVFKKIRK